MNSLNPKEVLIPAGTAELKAIFTVPSHPKGTVAFAHGSGSGRLSPRNNFVAQVLQEAGIATLLADLLEESEASDRRNVFDIIPGATHLFKEARALERVAKLARDWFLKYLDSPA